MAGVPAPGSVIGLAPHFASGGCKGSQGDDLKRHYSICPTLEAFGNKALGLLLETESDNRGTNFLILTGGAMEDKELAAKKALKLYAAYWARNKVRQWGTYAPEKCRQALTQGLAEGVRGHEAAAKLVDSIWIRK